MKRILLDSFIMALALTVIAGLILGVVLYIWKGWTLFTLGGSSGITS